MPPRAPIVSPGAAAAARAPGRDRLGRRLLPGEGSATTIFNKAERGRDLQLLPPVRKEKFAQITNPISPS